MSRLLRETFLIVNKNLLLGLPLYTTESSKQLPTSYRVFYSVQARLYDSDMSGVS